MSENLSLINLQTDSNQLSTEDFVDTSGFSDWFSDRVTKPLIIEPSLQTAIDNIISEPDVSSLFSYSNELSLAESLQIYRSLQNFHVMNYDLIQIKNSIKKNSKPSNKDVDFLFCIENNSNINLDKNTFNNIIDLKLELQTHNSLVSENKINMIFGNDENKVFNFHNNLSSSFVEKETLFENILLGINEKKEKLKSNSFYQKLKDFTFLGKNLEYFGIVNLNFVEEYNNSANKNYESISFNTNPSNLNEVFYVNTSHSIHSYLSSSYLSQTNFFVTSTNLLFRSQNQNRTACDDIITQVFVNLSRSLFCMSFNSFLNNYYDIDSNFKHIDIDQYELVNIVNTEPTTIKGLNLFKYINTKNLNFDKNKFLNESGCFEDYRLSNKGTFAIGTDNGIYSNITRESRGNFGVKFSTLYSQLSGDFYFPSDIVNYINNSQVNIYRETIHSFDRTAFRRHNDQNSAFNRGVNGIIQELNKFYNYEFFDIVPRNIINNFNVPRSGLNIILAYLSSENSIIYDRSNYFDYSNGQVAFRDKTIVEKFKSNMFEGGISHTGTIYYDKTPLVKKNTLNYVSQSNELTDNDCKTNINELEYKVTLDNLVKQAKIKYLTNNNKNVNIFAEIVDNIKKSKNNFCLLSYEKENLENISILNQENQAYNLLFTNSEEEEDIVYSNSDLTLDSIVKNTNFKSLENLRRNEEDINIENENVSNDILDLISNYYPLNRFFSSLTYYKNILNNLCSEFSVEDVNNNLKRYYDIANTQMIYFNYFLNIKDKDSEALKVILKRFFMKAVQSDSISKNFDLNKEESIKSYSYDYKSINKKDYDNKIEGDLTKYVNDVFNTSQNLETIKKEVFNLKNISSTSEKSRYLKTSNLCFKSDNNSFYFSCLFSLNCYPFYNMKYNYFNRNFDSFEKASELTFELSYLPEERSYPASPRESNEVAYALQEVISNGSVFITNGNKFQPYLSKNIIVKITPCIGKSSNGSYLNSITNSLLQDTRASILIEDKFDDACNTNKYVFNSIIKDIKSLLRLKIKDYEENEINSIEDVESFVEENQNILKDIYDIIILYGSIYEMCFNRIQRYSSLKIFSLESNIELNKKNYMNDDFGGNNQRLDTFGILSEHKRSTYLHNHSIFQNYILNNLTSEEDDNPIINSNILQEINKDLYNLKNYVNNKSLLFNSIENKRPVNNSLFQEDSWSSINTRKLKNIAKSLFLSDYSQTINFDILRGFIKNQKKNFDMTNNDLYESNYLNLISEDYPEIFEGINKNFAKDHFKNKLSKNINKENIKNSFNKNYFNLDNSENNFLSYYSNNDIFKYETENSLKKIRNLKNTIISDTNSDSSTNYVFGSSDEEYLNSNFYCIGLNKNSFEVSNMESIIKVTVNIVDLENLNHLYVPKVFLYSPILTDANFVNENIIDSLNGQLIGVYNINNQINNRFGVIDFNEYVNKDNTDIENLIKSKIFLSEEISTDQNDAQINQLSNKLYKHLLTCHQCSNISKNLISCLYSINDSDEYSNDIIEKNNYNLYKNLSDKEYYNIFGVKRQNFDSSLISVDENNVKFKDLEKIDSQYYTLNSLQNLHSTKKSINKLLYKEEDYYDKYYFPINTSSLFFLVTNNETLDDEIYQRVTLTELQKALMKTTGFYSLSQFAPESQFPAFYKNSSSAVKNFKIIIETEVL